MAYAGFTTAQQVAVPQHLQVGKVYGMAPVQHSFAAILPQFNWQYRLHGCFTLPNYPNEIFAKVTILRNGTALHYSYTSIANLQQ